MGLARIAYIQAVLSLIAGIVFSPSSRVSYRKKESNPW